MENKPGNIKDRVLYICEIEGIGREDFFNNLGISYANFKGKQKESALNSDTIVKILSKYKEIDPEWLLTGIGSHWRTSHISVEEVLSKKQKHNFINYLHDNVESDQSNYKELADARLEIIEGLKFKVTTLEKELAEARGHNKRKSS